MLAQRVLTTEILQENKDIASSGDLEKKWKPGESPERG